MGQTWFSGRRRNDHYYAPAPTATLAPVAEPTASDVPTPFRRASSYPPPIPPPSPPPPPPPPPASNFYPYNYYSHPQGCPYPTRSPFHPYYPHPPPGWRLPQPLHPNHPSFSSNADLPTPPPYVEHQQARTVKNDVNVHRETIRLEIDEHFPDRHVVSFTFDASVDGSITIFYFAKEGENCSFSSVYPELGEPTRIPFQKGSGQKFRQTPTSSIDFGFFELEELSNSSNGVFPLVIYAEAGQQHPVDEQQERSLDRAQITLAVIEKKGDGPFQVKVIKQILRMDGQRYELRNIFGIGSSTEAEVDEDAGKECVICMSEPRDTTVLPCCHMCMCSECAKALRLQTNKCPICRQPIKELLVIKIKDSDDQ